MVAPIVLFVYNRPQHTKITIDKLKENYLAKESELFIFSDAPKSKNDKEKVIAVREIIKSIDGFKKVYIYENQYNKGLADSVINGVTDIINKYGRVIVLEDDLITSKYFLKYMNESLDMYEKEEIWSISGYAPAIQYPKNYNLEVYLTYRGCSWGWATWKQRWNSVNWQMNDYKEFKRSRKLRRSFNQSGSDMSPMLDDQYHGRINSWAIRWCYNQFKQQLPTIYPVYSLVQNIGTDLSGTHSSSTTKYNVNLHHGKIVLDKNIEFNVEILKSFKKFYNLNIIGYLAIFIKKIGLYPKLRKYRNIVLIKIKK